MSSAARFRDEADTVPPDRWGWHRLGIGGCRAGAVIILRPILGQRTLALHIPSRAQKKGGIAAYVDAEHALDPAMQEAGLDIDEAAHFAADTANKREITIRWVASGGVDISYRFGSPALTPKANSRQMGDQLQPAARRG